MNCLGVILMKIASVSNNYGKQYDGVGAFAKVQNENYPDDVICINYTADCTFEASKLQRIFMPGMTFAINRLIKDFHKENFDVVMVEYPFVEWNPLIILSLLIVRNIAKKRRCKLVLSLHEYIRVNALRKLVIKIMCKLSDIVFVSNEEMKSAVSEFSNQVCIRPIPTNLYNQEAMTLDIVQSTQNYVFFGLVNKVKAFYEMLDAWDIYNKDGKKTLYILTASQLSDIENKHIGVKYLYKQDDYTIIKILRSCVGCIVPIKPLVDNKNATFKTSCISGCISIGKFCDEYKELPFVINMPDYNINSFLCAFEQLDGIGEDDRIEKSKKAIEFGQKFVPKQEANSVYEQLCD